MALPMRAAVPLVAILLACRRPAPPEAPSASGGRARTPCVLPEDSTAVIAADAADEPPRPLSNLSIGQLPNSYRNVCARGRLVARFVIDASGAVRPRTVDVIESRVNWPGSLEIGTPPLDQGAFQRIVRDYLETARFTPAVCQGRPVASSVEQAWAFRTCS